MRAILQIVKKADLSVKGELISQIEKGLVVYLGIHIDDTKEIAEKLAIKVANLRIFKDTDNKINLNVKNAGNNILVVSNFTIYADTTRGNRPNFSYAMHPEKAQEIYNHFIEILKSEDINVKGGVFGANMQINQISDGPVNIILEL